MAGFPAISSNISARLAGIKGMYLILKAFLFFILFVLILFLKTKVHFHSIYFQNDFLEGEGFIFVLFLTKKTITIFPSVTIVAKVTIWFFLS